MKRTSIVFVFVILLLSMASVRVSAFEFDNVKSYDPATKTITVTNAFGLGDKIAEITLDTPLINRVSRGYQKVAQFTIVSFEDYTDSIKELEFYDKHNDLSGFSRNFDYKVLSYENVNVEDWIQECNTVIIEDQNGTKSEDQTCELVFDGVHSEEREVWNKIIKKDLTAEDITTIGIFTEVEKGDKVEWIPNFFGVRGDEWAVWVESLNVDLQSYWDFESTVDIVAGLSNLTANEGAPVYNETDCLIGDCGQTWSNNNFKVDPSAGWNMSSRDWTYNLWARSIDSPDPSSQLIGIDNAQLSNIGFGSSSGIVQRSDTWDGVSGNMATVGRNNWFMVTVTRDETINGNVSIYINGTIMVSGTKSKVNNTQVIYMVGTIANLGQDWHGQVDEMAFWNRTLTGSEISDLYNGGSGLTYTVIFPPIVTLNTPTNYFNTTSGTITFNWSVHDVIQVDNSSLYINGVFNQTIIHGTSNYTNEQVSLSFADGTYTWNVNATDDENNKGTSGLQTFTIDTITPTINPLNLTYKYHKKGTNLSLSLNVTDVNKDSCWYNYQGGANTTFTCTDNIISFNVTSYANRTILLYANDTVNNLNTTTHTWNYKLFEESQSFNASSYDTSTESYVAYFNGTVDISSANHIQLGTSTTGTVTNGNITTASKTHSAALGSAPFYWNITLSDATNLITANQTQTVNPSNLSYCGITPAFLNFTFKDEADLSVMNATNDLADFDLWLGDGTSKEELITSNFSLNNPSYAFCFAPIDRTVTVDMTFKYAFTGYPLRTFTYSEQALTNTTTDVILYLLGSANGIYSSIQIQDISYGAISGATVTAERQISGVWATIEQGTSDSSGTVTFWVNPNFDHRFTVVASGYATQQVTIKPSQTIYTMTMASSSNVTYNSEIKGLQWLVRPGVGVVYSGTKNFNVTFRSTDAALENCKLELLNSSDVTQIFATTTSAATNSTYCYTGVDYLVVGDVNFFGRLSVDTDETSGTSYVVVDADIFYLGWFELDWDETGYRPWNSVSSFFTELGSLSEFGTGNEASFSKMIFFFLMATILVGIFTYITGYEIETPGMSIFIIVFIVLFASAGGFLTIDLYERVCTGGICPSAIMEQWAFTFILMIVGVGYGFNTVRRFSE